MCDNVWHGMGNEVWLMRDGLTLTEQCLLHLALMRDCHQTEAEKNYVASEPCELDRYR